MNKRTLLPVAMLLLLTLPLQGQAPSTLPTLTITVNYSLPLAQQIAAGKFDRVHPNLTAKSFPPSQSGTKPVSVAVLTIPRSWIKTDQVLQFIDRQGYRPATIEELIAFAAAYPNEWRTVNLVAALGSGWTRGPGVKDVPYVNVYEGKRWLWLRPLYLDWVDTQKFLVIKK